MTSDRQTIWIDVERCTGCGVCVKACPAGAIALVDGKARVTEEACTGCAICVDACPQKAIQPVLRGELVLAPERAAPAVYRPSPLAETTGVAVVATGIGLFARAAGALGRAIGRWLSRLPAETRAPAAGAPSAYGGAIGRGRRARHRRRGR